MIPAGGFRKALRGRNTIFNQKGKAMKKIKKILALVLALAMVVGTMSMTAFAADGDPTGSITVKPNTTVTLTNKSFKAYRILDATYGTGTLPTQPVAYTIPAKMATFYNDYFKQVADDTATPPVEAKSVAELADAAGKTVDQYVVDRIAALTAAELKDFEYEALAAAKTAGVTVETGAKDGDNFKFSNLKAGYYVIEDEGTATPISALMLDTVTDANVDIELKAKDESKKEVMTADELVNSKANELGLGRAVNYKITQKVPDTTGYDYYYYMINDTLSSGLTFNPATVVVKVGGTELTKDTDYYLYYDDGTTSEANTATKAILNGKTFIVAFKDIVADVNDENKPAFVENADIIVTYTATVNSNAVTGVNPNTNDANVTYSNNPDKDGKGDYDNDHPGIPKNDENHPTGEGPHKFTDTYTTKLTIVKYDASTNTKTKLEGVEFTLTGTAKDAVFNAEEVYEIDPAGTYWLLKNGKYTETAPTAATVAETTGGAGWVEIAADETVADGVPVRVVGDKSYRPYVEATDSAKTRYTIVESNAGDYTSTTTKYSKKIITADAAEEYEVKRTGITGSDGKLEFAQLGAGSYKLSETGVLAGFNGVEDITFDIKVTLPAAADVIAGTETATWAVENVQNGDITYDAETGEFQIEIDNKKGTELPSTGGIGTTIFYVAGTILVLCAGVVLVTRRRMTV
jgi:fimbrial isopeptide formation D2 family protein/LPXTG-motif cell wall-anchored protein